MKVFRTSGAGAVVDRITAKGTTALRANDSHVALAAPSGELTFVTRSPDGLEVQRGTFVPGRHPVSLLVVADYAILARPGLAKSARDGLIGLLPPDPSLDVDAVSRRWIATPERDRAMLGAAELRDLRPYFDARAELAGYREQCIERARELLLAVSLEYYGIVSANDRLIPEVLPLLRTYPSPQHLQAAGSIQLSHTLRTALPSGRQQLIDRLQRLRQETPDSQQVTVDAEFAASMLPSTIDHWMLLNRQCAEIDDRIYRAGSGAANPPPAVGSSLSLLSLASPVAPVLSESGDPAFLLERVEALFTRRSTPERHPRSDYEDYRRIRTSLDAPSSQWEPADRLRVETIGQLLALSAGEYLDAIRARAACDEILADAAAWQGVPPELANRLRADAALAMALIDVCAVDGVLGFPALRSAVEAEAAGSATPELLAEAMGLLCLILALYGEHDSYSAALETMRAVVAKHGTDGPSRAPADLTEHFIASIRPDTPPELLHHLQSTADEQSRNTPYRSFFNYNMMLASYVSKDTEAGFLNFSEMCRDGLWERFAHRTFRLARLAHAMLLASAGNFAAARKELAAVHDQGSSASGGAEALIHAFISLRLDLAVGRHSVVLAQTAYDGPLGESSLIGLQLRRYVPLSLILQGTALMREGSTSLAAASFLRATQFSVASGEWLTALGAETAEFRDWFSRLDRDHLPAGLTQECSDAILGKPIYIDHTLPLLTRQQTRILDLLAHGRSIQSIASELHITHNTMKSHLRRLYERLEVNSREQAVTRAAAYGLLT